MNQPVTWKKQAKRLFQSKPETTMRPANMILDIAELVALYNAKKLELDEPITTRNPLSQINEGLESLEKEKSL